MNALQFANEHENVIVRIAGNGCPAGRDIAWIGGETELPFDLGDVEGEIGEDGEFTANNLTDGPGAWDWKFSDWGGNLIYAIWLRVDQSVWQEQYDEWNAVG